MKYYQLFLYTLLFLVSLSYQQQDQPDEKVITLSVSDRHEASVEFGSNKDTAVVQVTLATDLTMVTSQWCLTCLQKVYDSAASKSRTAGKYGVK